MSAWTKMTAAEKTSAARSAVKTRTLAQAAEFLGTTKGAVAGALYREGRLARREATLTTLTRDELLGAAEVVGAAYGLSPGPLLGMDERQAVYTGARHVLWYLLAQYDPPSTLRGPHGSWRKRRETDGNGGNIARAWKCSPYAVQKAIKLVEDLRDDPAFDARLTELEHKLGLT